MNACHHPGLSGMMSFYSASGAGLTTGSDIKMPHINLRSGKFS
jgi:hypothetical protein